MAKNYSDPVTTFPSKSNPNVTYTVKCETNDGVLTCDCPAWRFKKNGQERTCTHVRAVLKRMQDRVQGGMRLGPR